jgi:hypothetical protein
MMTTNEPETELSSRRLAAEAPTPLAWSEPVEDRPVVDYPETGSSARTVLYGEQVDNQDDAYRYDWITVGMAAGFLVVVLLAVAVTVFVTHRVDVSSMPTPAPVTVSVGPSTSTVPAASTPDDKIVAPPAAPAPPPAAAAPPDADNSWVADAISIKTQTAAYGTSDTEQRARTIAIFECKQVRGADDCIDVEAIHNGCVSVVFNAKGAFEGGRGPDAASARQDAITNFWHPGEQSLVASPACSK